MKSLLTFAIVAVAAITVPARADVIWDQSTLDPAGPGQANSYSPGFGGFVIHGVQDVTITTAVTIDTITQYYSSWNFDWPSAVTTGYVHVWPKTGPLPTDDASTSPSVPMTAAFGAPDVIEVTATGLGISVGPGDYWIGITPVAPAGISGANLQYSTAQVGDAVASYDLSSWSNFYPGYDGAIRIEGTMPVSTESTTWTQVKNLYR